MTFKPGADIDGHAASSGGFDSSTTSAGGFDYRSTGASWITAGGGLGSLVLIGLFLLLGGNPANLTHLLNPNQAQNQAQHQAPNQAPNQSPNQAQHQAQKPPALGAQDKPLAHCRTSEDGNKFTDCRIEFTAISVDRVWAQQLPIQAGLAYTEPARVIFHGSTRTGCGTANSATGPFYCPADQSAYFDPDFFAQLQKFGAHNAPLAQMYVVAHEFGHHIQNLEGTLSLSNYNHPGADSNAVKIELQADCYAGLWAHYADKGPNALLETITDQQVQDAITAARAVGDDNLQKRAGAQVRPDAFTHGTSAQRADAFLRGYRSGKMDQCDFLGRKAYRN